MTTFYPSLKPPATWPGRASTDEAFQVPDRVREGGAFLRLETQAGKNHRGGAPRV